MSNKKLNSPNQKAGIPDMDKIYSQYENDVSIRQLSFMHNIPYATLHRAIKSMEREKGRGKKGVPKTP